MLLMSKLKKKNTGVRFRCGVWFVGCHDEFVLHGVLFVVRIASCLY